MKIIYSGFLFLFDAMMLNSPTPIAVRKLFSTELALSDKACPVAKRIIGTTIIDKGIDKATMTMQTSLASQFFIS